MKEKRALTQEIARRYRRTGKKEKRMILNEFTRTTGYNRKYAIHLLANWGKKRIQMIDGKPVQFVVGKLKKRKKGRGTVIYDEPVQKAIRRLWEFFDYMCGKRLAVLIRMNLTLLLQDPELSIDTSVKDKLLTISPATIDRILKPERKKLTLKSRSKTKPGTLLKKHIPIRTYFDWDERKAGFFELDTVGHDGGSTSGEYCFTLNATDVYSGWVELRSLRNRGHRWVKDEIELIHEGLPFPLLGVDSDNGGEFINKLLWGYCTENDIVFTRSRSYRKNDNCFVEQKNDLAVRRTVGYYRFDTQEEYEALKEVYIHLCPLLNFFYPSFRLIEKVRNGSHVKKVYDDPKTPYVRLLESPDLEKKHKEKLKQRMKKIHIVKQKRLVDQAVAQLLRLYEEKKQNNLSFDEKKEISYG